MARWYAIANGGGRAGCAARAIAPVQPLGPEGIVSNGLVCAGGPTCIPTLLRHPAQN